VTRLPFLATRFNQLEPPTRTKAHTGYRPDLHGYHRISRRFGKNSQRQDRPPRHIPLTGLTTRFGQRHPIPTDATAYGFPTTQGGLHPRPHLSLTPQGHKSDTFKRCVPTFLSRPKTTKTANLIRKRDSRSTSTPRREPKYKRTSNIKTDPFRYSLVQAPSNSSRTAVRRAFHDPAFQILTEMTRLSIQTTRISQLEPPAWTKPHTGYRPGFRGQPPHFQPFGHLVQHVIQPAHSRRNDRTEHHATPSNAVPNRRRLVQVPSNCECSCVQFTYPRPNPAVPHPQNRPKTLFRALSDKVPATGLPSFDVHGTDFRQNRTRAR
jgi:hypothetical protein